MTKGYRCAERYALPSPVLGPPLCTHHSPLP